ncbi:MAG: hypothetical protein H7287_03150 [Thermoleophilia bacterium]|nr:hypothetical protein [Thermoleophilia bacterium]
MTATTEPPMEITTLRTIATAQLTHVLTETQFETVSQVATRLQGVMDLCNDQGQGSRLGAELGYSGAKLLDVIKDAHDPMWSHEPYLHTWQAAAIEGARNAISALERGAAHA